MTTRSVEYYFDLVRYGGKNYFYFLPPELIVKIIKYITRVKDIVSFSLTSTRHLELVKTHLKIISCYSYVHKHIISQFSLSSIKIHLKYYKLNINHCILYYSCKNNDPEVLKLIMNEYDKIESKYVIHHYVEESLHHFVCGTTPLQLQMIMEFANIKINEININWLIACLPSYLSSLYFKTNINNLGYLTKNIMHILKYNPNKLLDKNLIELLACSAQYECTKLFGSLLVMFNIKFNEDAPYLYNPYTSDSDLANNKNCTKYNVVYCILINKIINKGYGFVKYILKKYNLPSKIILNILSRYLETVYLQGTIELLRYYICDCSINFSKEDMLDHNILIKINEKLSRRNLYYMVYYPSQKNLKQIFKKLQITKKDVESTHVYFLKEIRKLVSAN